MAESNNSIVSIPVLFLIGLSAGAIATSFPRMAPLLTEINNDVSFDLLTPKFFVIAGVFSIMIGVSMIWMYKGTTEHTKALFLSALALPAVLSGALNTSNVASITDQKLGELDTQTQILQDKLESQNSVEFIDLKFDNIELTPISFIPNLLGISSAYAEESPRFPIDGNLNKSIFVKAKTLDKSFTLLYGEFEDEKKLLERIEELKSKSIKNISMFKVKNKTYIINNVRLTKTNALIKVIDFKSKYGINTKIVNIK